MPAETETKPDLPPFACTFSPSLPALLWHLGCSIAISTYQAGKVIFMSATSPQRMIQVARDFPSAMGLAQNGLRMAVATLQDVVILANSPDLAPTFPPKPATYDGLYVPRANYYTGQMNVHDMGWGKRGLWVVNTRMSCLCLVDEEYNFRPMWMPPFVSELDTEDRCHLNGMAVDDEPRYATAFCPGNKKGAWRDFDTTKVGLLMEVPSGKIILDGLCRPHSPRLYRGQLYVCNSGSGEVLKVDPEKKTFEVIAKVEGWARGVAFHGDYMFIGISKMREGRGQGPRDLPVLEGETHAGVVVLDIRNGYQKVAEMTYQSSVEQIYDLLVVPSRRPNILNPDSPETRLALSTPQATYWGQRGKEKKEDAPGAGPDAQAPAEKPGADPQANS